MMVDEGLNLRDSTRSGTGLLKHGPHLDGHHGIH